jgi:hypothetical protein
LSISDKTNANEVKDKLVKFVDEYKGQEIDEIFFYFSGHGEFYDNEFYYLMSDYSSTKRKTTTLQNTELDSMLRALNPKLAIKFVDACNAGVTYVKEDNALEKYMKQSQSTFNNCYFMFSSQQKQLSYQDDKLSDFTKSLLLSIKEHSMPSIRYKNIIDYISDYFEGNTLQTPLFVTQADFTEVFTDIKKELIEYLSPRLDGTATPPAGEKINLASSIEDLIKAEAKIFCSKEEAIVIINELPARIEKFCKDALLDSLYEYAVNTGLVSDKLPKISTVGQWLKDNKHHYFARPAYSIETYEEYDDELSAFGLLSTWQLGKSRPDRADRKKVTKHRKVVNGLELTEEIPFNHLEVIANSKYPNIDSFALHIVFVLSKTELRFFSFYAKFIETGWDKRRLEGDVKWKTVAAKLKDNDDIQNKIQDILSEFKKTITDYIEEKFAVRQPSLAEGENEQAAG